MPEPLKNIYNRNFFDNFTAAVQQVMPDFDPQAFLHAIYDDDWENRELKQRMRHITTVLDMYLPHDYKARIASVLKIIRQLQQNGLGEPSFAYMFFPDFITPAKPEDYKTAVYGFEHITQFTSCEFAVRPFIIAYPRQMMQQMLRWSSHQNAMVRRLSSEGCRPRLPWAVAITALKKDPMPVIPILENLKNDTSESVRRSVANNLNDISKDHPETVIGLVKRWQGKTRNTDWIIKHGCRTLLKQAHPEALDLFGFGVVKNVEIRDFCIQTPEVRVGEKLEFSFRLINSSENPVRLRLEYGLYYRKANGSLSKKVFKISEKVYSGHSMTTVNRKQSFKIITTRKYYAGGHRLSLIINGKELEKKDFELISPGSS